MTLGEFRAELAASAGRTTVNGLPYSDGQQIMCVLCRRPLEDEMVVRVWEAPLQASVAHQDCEEEPGEPHHRAFVERMLDDSAWPVPRDDPPA